MSTGVPALNLRLVSTGVCVLTLWCAVPVWSGQSASSPPRNITAVTFECPDHDRDTGHEVDIVRVSDGVVIQTIQGGDPAADANGDVTIKLNVQPVAFGAYRVVVRAMAGALRSVNSEASEVWERVPGAPLKPRVGG